MLSGTVFTATWRQQVSVLLCYWCHCQANYTWQIPWWHFVHPASDCCNITTDPLCLCAHKTCLWLIVLHAASWRLNTLKTVNQAPRNVAYRFKLLALLIPPSARPQIRRLLVTSTGNSNGICVIAGHITTDSKAHLENSQYIQCGESREVSMNYRSSKCTVEIAVCSQINASAPPDQQQLPVSCLPAAEWNDGG